MDEHSPEIRIMSERIGERKVRQQSPRAVENASQAETPGDEDGLDHDPA